MTDLGRRVERVEYGLRAVRDSSSHRQGRVDQRDSIEQAVQARDTPFCGWDGDEQVVTRTIVTYTTNWTPVPGHDGSRWFSCWHKDRPAAHEAARLAGAATADGYARPLEFRERDLIAGEDGIRRYTCPACGLVWRHRDDTPPPADPAAPAAGMVPLF